MKIKEIQELIDFISETGLNEVNIKTSDIELSIVRDPKVKQQVVEAAPRVAAAPAPGTASPTPPAADSGASEPKAADDAGNTVPIKSPMIGTFYSSPNPDAPPFVKVGDKVSKGQTVCVVEAMKLFNEIESEVSGTIVKVLVEDSTPVEYDQPLYLVEPS